MWRLHLYTFTAGWLSLIETLLVTFLLYICPSFYIPPSGPSSSPKSALIIMDTTRSIFSLPEALYHLIVVMLTLGQGVYSMPVPTDVPMCTASETAQYRLTFTGKWTQAAFPKQYPVYRPPAQWSNLIGKCTASSCWTVFSLVTVLAADVEQHTDWMPNRKLM